MLKCSFIDLLLLSLLERPALLLQVSFSHSFPFSTPAVPFYSVQACAIYDSQSLSILAKLLHIWVLIHPSSLSL